MTDTREVPEGRRPTAATDGQHHQLVDGGVSRSPQPARQLDGRSVDSGWPMWTGGPTADGAGPVWVAADESGSTGEGLLDVQGVFAHAAVRIDDATAASLLSDLRREARASQPSEVKVAQFNSRRGRGVLAAALGRAGLCTTGSLSPWPTSAS